MKSSMSKRSFFLTIALVLIMALAMIPGGAVLAVTGDITVNVYVVDSGGSPISGALIYNGPGVANFGTTDGAGHTSKNFSGTTTNLEVWAKHNNTFSTHVIQNISSNPVFNFHTNNVTLRLETCSAGTPLTTTTPPGYGIGTASGTWYWPGGNTGSGANPAGESAAEIFPGTYSFRMQYGQTTEIKSSVNIPDADTMLTWKTTKVTLNYSGTITYGGSGGAAYFISPMELLPGTYKFKFGGSSPVDINISGCSMTKNVAVLVLKDHNGSPLAGGTGRGGYGASYWTWHVPGSTDANGKIVDIRDAGSTIMSYEMRYNNTTKAMTQDVAVNPVFNFKTIELTLRLEDSTAAPLNNGKARYGNGATYTTWWFPGGVTGTSAPGETKAEIFPGTYSFEMQYKLTADAKISEVIPNANTILTWQTVPVTPQIAWPGQISYGGPVGDYAWFIKPSMELLPGTYWLHYRGGITQQETWPAPPPP